MEPATVVALAKKYGDALDESMVAARYATRDFTAFIEAYKWVTSYLRAPADYTLAAGRMCEQMLAQNIVYAEVTLSAGVKPSHRTNLAACICNGSWTRCANSALRQRVMSFDLLRDCATRASSPSVWAATSFLDPR
jgi:Adenosine deaminase